MRARAALVAEPGPTGTRLTHAYAEPPFAFRPTPAAVYLAAGAAGPLGGDRTELDLDIRPGARLALRTVAATVALGGASPSRATIRARVGAGGTLCWHPEPLIVADGAEHFTRTEINLAEDCGVSLREIVVFGRAGEAGGIWDASLRVRVAGREVLVAEQRIDPRDPASTGPFGTGGNRALGSELRISPGDSGVSRVGEGWAVLPLAAGCGALTVAVGGDVIEIHARLRAARAQDPR